MKSNYIPLSTCVGDPQWFHQGTYNKSIQFKDKNGVWNGLRAEPFVPGEECNGLCGGAPCPRSPGECLFLNTYKHQLNQLNFDEVIQRFENIANTIQQLEGFTEEPVCVLIFHEKYDNPCSERWPVVEWFKEHHYPIQEFNL